MNTPKIYVGTYAKYNNGSLFGKWMDLTDYFDSDEFYEACRELHADEEGPELMFQDWDNIPDLFVNEMGYLSEDFWLWQEQDEDKQDLIKTVLKNGLADDVESALDEIDDNYVGFYSGDALTAYTIEHIAEGGIGEIPEYLENYIDVDAVARDLKHQLTILGGYVFRSY